MKDDAAAIDCLPVALTNEALARHLTTDALGRVAVFVETCLSTNDIAATRAREGAAHGMVVVSDTQTGGRGRMGRSWHSPPGENLYASLLLRPDLPPAAVPPLTLLVGAAVAEALDVNLGPSGDGAGIRTQVKWPNDLVLPSPTGPRKVGGILTEMSTSENRVSHVVVGIGVNVNTTQFPDELTGQATSLRQTSGHAHDRVALLAAILAALEPRYARFVDGGGAAYAVEQWRPRALLGYRCRVQQDSHTQDSQARDSHTRETHTIEGWARNVDTDGALLVVDDQGRAHRVASGEAAAVSSLWRAPPP